MEQLPEAGIAAVAEASLAAALSCLLADLAVLLAVLTATCLAAAAAGVALAAAGVAAVRALFFGSSFCVDKCKRSRHDDGRCVCSKEGETREKPM